MLNYGNHGYHGTEKLLKSLKKEENAYFILSSFEYQNVDSNSQFNMDVIDYVLRNYQMIDKVGDYEIYQKVS